jgi:hypothetical protein
MRTARSIRGRRLVLLGVLAGSAVAVGLVVSGAFAAQTPSAPTIGSSPAAVTNQTAATFTFSGAPGSGSYQCKLDAAAFAACSSPKCYTGLAVGGHVFQVKALDNKGVQGPATSFSWTIDLTAPTLSAIVRVDSSPTNSGPLNWTVSFSEPVNGVAAGNLTVVRSNVTGTLAALSVASVGSAPSASWTVTLPTTGLAGLNNGSIGLNLSSVGAIKDAATNALATSSFTGQAYGYDTTVPTVVSINRAGASATVNSGPLAWTVTFSEPVGGLATSNFALATAGLGGSAPSISSATAVGGAPSATWTVSVSTAGTTGGNGGSIGLNLASTTNVKDTATNNLSATTPLVGQAYGYDTTAPTVTVNRKAGQADPANALPILWTVTFSEPVSGFDATDLTRGGTATGGSVAVTGSGAGYEIAVTNPGSNLSNGTISFTIAANKALDAAGNSNSASTSSDNTVGYDTVAPTVVSINRVGVTPTNAASLSWTVTFSEPVTGVATSNFTLVAAGFTGTPLITGLTGSGSVYTVTASTTSTTTNSATLQLRLASVGLIKDAATNALTGAPVNGQTYTVDRLAPPVAFGIKPPDPSNTATSNFTWSSSPAAADFDHYECSTENGAFSTTVQSLGGPAKPCASPLTYVVATTNNGQHQFDLRVYDHLGNFTQITWSWKVEAGSIQDFTINGNALGLLYPGGVARPIAVTLTNPNAIPIYVTVLTVAANTNTPNGCTPSELVFQQANLAGATSSPNAIVVPANGSVTLPAQGVAAPTIRLVDNGTNQTPRCANQTFTLSYGGSAHS